MESIKDYLIPYISHLDSSKKMYGALTNLFSVRNIGQVMSLKNELRDMKVNDDDNITSYFVRISQLRDQLQAIEEIISEKELVKHSTQWSSQDVGCIFRKHEHKKRVSDI
jgi:hypothetical protein